MRPLHVTKTESGLRLRRKHVPGQLCLESVMLETLLDLIAEQGRDFAGGEHALFVQKVYKPL